MTYGPNKLDVTPMRVSEADVVSKGYTFYDRWPKHSMRGPSISSWSRCCWAPTGPKVICITRCPITYFTERMAPQRGVNSCSRRKARQNLMPWPHVSIISCSCASRHLRRTKPAKFKPVEPPPAKPDYIIL